MLLEILSFYLDTALPTFDCRWVLDLYLTVKKCLQLWPIFQGRVAFPSLVKNLAILRVKVIYLRSLRLYLDGKELQIPALMVLIIH